MNALMSLVIFVLEFGGFVTILVGQLYAPEGVVSHSMFTGLVAVVLGLMMESRP